MTIRSSILYDYIAPVTTIVVGYIGQVFPCIDLFALQEAIGYLTDFHQY